MTLFSSGGQCKSGWDEVGQFFPWLAGRFSDGSGFSFDLEVADISGDLAYTVGFERYSVSITGGPVEPRLIRVTHVYRREKGEWKIVHRHGDSLPIDFKPPRYQPLRDPTETAYLALLDCID